MSGSVLFNLLFLVTSIAIAGALALAVGRYLPSENAFRMWIEQRLERMGFVEFARFIGLLVLAVAVCIVGVLYS